MSVRPLVENVRVNISEDRYVHYWYNFSRKLYQYVRSEEPLCVMTDKSRCLSTLSAKELREYVKSKHSEGDRAIQTIT